MHLLVRLSEGPVVLIALPSEGPLGKLKCDITAHSVLLYVLFCFTYMYCTL